MKRFLILLCSLVMLFICSSVTVFAGDTSEAGGQVVNIYVSHVYDASLKANGSNIVSSTSDSKGILLSDWTLYGYLQDSNIGNESYTNSEVKLVAVSSDGSLEYDISKVLYSYSVYFNHYQNDVLVRESTDDSFPVSFSYLGYGARTKNIECNFGGFLVFDSRDTFNEFIETGDESGIINKPSDGDIQTDDTFALTGFTADNTITASWTGTTHDDKSANYAEMFVELTTGYAYVNAPGQIATTEPYVGEYQIADKTFTKLRSELQPSDNSIFLRYLEVVPYYKLESGLLVPPYRGKSCFVWLNPDGSIEKITNTYLPEFSDSISDRTLGYLQDVRYVEDYNTHDFTITWSVLNNYDDSYHIQIMADVAAKDSLSSPIVVTKCSWIEFSDNLKYSKGMLSGNTVSVVNECLGSTDYFHYDVYRYYLRIVKYDESTQSYKVGGWVKLAVDHDSPSSGSPVLSDVVTGDFDSDTGDWITDNESDDSYHDKQNGQSGESIIDNPNYIIGTDDAGNLDMVTLGKSFLNSVNGLFSYVGRLPSLIGSLFVFIPATILALIGLGIIIAIILRILGR